MQELPAAVGIRPVYILSGRVAVWRPDELAGRTIDETSDMAGRCGIVLCHRGYCAVLSILLVHACEAMEEHEARNTQAQRLWR